MKYMGGQYWMVGYEREAQEFTVDPRDTLPAPTPPSRLFP